MAFFFDMHPSFNFQSLFQRLNIRDDLDLLGVHSQSTRKKRLLKHVCSLQIVPTQTDHTKFTLSATIKMIEQRFFIFLNNLSRF